jgi:hypothetical protein
MRVAIRSLVIGVVFSSTWCLAQEPCRSGPQAGSRPGPYSSIVITGNNRGTSHCFICETAEKPAVIIFARELTDSLGKLAHSIDEAIGKNKDSDLRSWLTLVQPDQTKVDAQIVKWAKQHAVSKVPISVFEDLVGPPSYKLTREAEVTVLLAVNEKVVANFAFRAGELTDARVEEVLKAVPGITKK